MKHFFSALRFLTVLRLGQDTAFAPSAMLPHFPLVGLLIGVLLALVDGVSGWLWPRPVAALVDLLFLTWVTGALHVDGLGDTADGLYGHRPKEAALAIMKDSRIGAMGGVAIFFGLAAKWGALSAIDAGRPWVLMAVPALARTAQVWAMRQLPYGRSDGVGSGFFKEPVPGPALWGGLVPVFMLLFLGLRGILLLAAFWGISFGMVRLFRGRMGCITGDMLGALNEVCEAGLFLAAAVGGAF